MVDRISAVVARTEQRPRERFDDPALGDVSWFTLFSADITPTERMCGGVAELEPGSAGLALHRHAEPEIYYLLAGHGRLTIDGVQTDVTEGAAVFIPGDAEHGMSNLGSSVLRVLYMFPTGRFSDVIYRFSAAGNR